MTSVLILLSGFDPGTYFIEDDGIANNGIAQLRGPDGSVIFFNIPTEFLTVTASAGRSVVFNLTESFGAADINVGNLTNSAENPDSITIQNIRGAGDVLLVSNGSITELGSDAAADITANTLILSAGTGVGTGINAIETQVGTLEAETETGGINLRNTGNVIVGGLTDDVNGLDVNLSGDLTLISSGSIVLSDESPGGFESVHGGTTSGNVTLIASGSSSDIVANVDQDSIAAPGGSIFLTAGRDVSFGTLGLNFDNDVRARGDLVITTGRDLNVDGFADLASDGFGAATGGDVIVNAGRDINVLNSTGTDGSIGAEGSGSGDVVLTTGPGGFVRLLASSTSTLFSSTGDVSVNTDRMVVNATAGITASGGIVSIHPRTGGWAMDLGSVTDGAFALELSDAELDRIFTPTLRLGDSSTGPITISSAVSPAAATNLLIRGGTDLIFNAALTVTGQLSLRAGDNILQVAASAITATGVDALVDELGDDDNAGGIGIFNGTITAAPITLVGNAEADTLNGSGAGETIVGNAGNDTLRGFGGNDSLNGGLGTDSLDGGLGDDFFFVDGTDSVAEAVGEGNDRVFASTSYVLTAGAAVEMLTTTSTAGTGAINLTGNELAQIIQGNAGANTLDSGGGGDTMFGFGGDDIYIVRAAGDRAVEVAGAGNDTVLAAVSFTLEANSAVETLRTISEAATTAINLTGNALTQSIIGNAGANTLDSNGGGDAMAGLGGDDFYFIRAAGDRAIEATASGADRVFAGLSFALEANSSIETLSTTNNAGTTAINLTGNALTQTIFGNAGANWLDSGGGGDTMVGFGGNDFYFIRTGTDRAVEAAAAGADRVFAAVSFTLEAGSEVEIISTTDQNLTTALNLTGNALVQAIIGNAGANSLDSGGGGDTMVGLGGDDFYFVHNSSDRAVEAAAGGTDRVFAAVNFTLEAGSAVETISTDFNAGVGAINLTGNELAQTVFGNAGVNVLDGKAGLDTLTGFAGADTFAFTTALGAGNVDQVTDFQAGVDKIRLENAIFTGLAPGALPAGAFVVGAAAVDADDRIIYNNATGALLFDADGVGGAAAVQFATLLGLPVIAASDFTVI
jgi:Ca2+-binding RTX toxin-like protein